MATEPDNSAKRTPENSPEFVQESFAVPSDDQIHVSDQAPAANQLQEHQSEQKGLAAKAGVFGVIAVLLLKFKVYIFTALKALSFIKFAWIFKSFGTMALSVGVYTMVFGWRYAVTLVALIYVHEMGHYMWMKSEGLEPQAPVFVPMLGAYTAMQKLPPDLATHAWVAWAGPFVGGLGAYLCYCLGVMTNNAFLVAAANTGAILNLFQLLPVKPFDGGFIAQSISRKLMIPGVLLFIWLAFTMHSILLMIICAVCIFVMIAQYRAGDSTGGMIPASGTQKIFISIAFIGLAAALAYLYWQSESITQSMIRH
jgi:Zn-dependent protease